jgi:hypothetical protein
MTDNAALVVDGSWVKTSRPNRWWKGQLSYTDAYALLVTVALPDRILWAKSRTVGGAPLDVSFYLHDLSNEDLRTQIMFRVGDGWAQDAIVELERSDYLSDATFPCRVQPSSWTEIFRVDATPTASVGLLALPRATIHMGRTGVWRCRDECPREVPDELHEAVRAGRKGVSLRARDA